MTIRSLRTRGSAAAARRDPTGCLQDGTKAAGPAQSAHWRGSAILIPSTILLAACMSFGGAMPVVAQGVDASCELELGTEQEPGAVAHLQDSIAAGAGITNPDVSFVVGYSMTGAAPVICINADEVDITEPLTEADEIPGEVADSVDILAVEEAFFLRYQLNNGFNDGLVEKRFCHTVGVEGHTDCFIIFAIPADELPDDPDHPSDFGPVTVRVDDLEIASQLELDPESLPRFFQAPIGIASQVCPEGANELTRRIRQNGTTECTAVAVSEAFINLVAAQL